MSTPAAAELSLVASPGVETPLRRVVGEFAESRVALFGLTLLVITVTAAAFAPLLALHDPYDLRVISIMDSMLPPGSKSLDGRTFWLGTDDQGRDMLSAILYGLRISLTVGIVSGMIAFVLGSALGLIAAFAGGYIDTMIMRFADLILGMPAILIALLIVALFGRGIDKVIIALVFVQWVLYARTARASALVEMRKEYVEAASCLALGRLRILFRHIMPNCLPVLMVICTIEIAHAIVLESTLSFLGVGLPITSPSLGLLISNGYRYMLGGKFWISFFPGIALLIAVFGMNLVADRLRDVLNPRLQR